MKTQASIKAAVVIAAAVASASAYAQGDRNVGIDTPESIVVEMFYDNPAYNQGIHSYPNPVPTIAAASGRVIYVNTAYGPAIYSYPGNGGTVTVEKIRLAFHNSGQVRP